MTPAATIRAALADPNVGALIGVIRAKESSNDDSAFTVINGGAHFTAPPWIHPFHGITTTQAGRSTAAGCGQFLGTTWANLAQQYPDDCRDFSPPAQLFGIVALIAGRGALDDVIAGRFDDAVAKLRKEWTSLPGASESRADWTLDKARALYQQFGGTLAPAVATATPAPTATPPRAIPQETNMGAGLILGLVQSILPLFTGGAQTQIAPILDQVKTLVPGSAPPAAGSKDDAIIQLATSMMGMILQHGGAPAGVTPATATPAQMVQATAAVAADPVKIAVVEQDTLARLSAPGGVFDRLAAADKAANEASIAGKNAAMIRQQSADPALVRIVVQSITRTKAGILIGLGLSIIAAIVCKSIWKDAPDYVVPLLTLLGPLVGSAFKESGAVVAYYMDGTPTSNASNAINAELAAKK
jgi:muramidase (phage lysozyme)